MTNQQLCALTLELSLLQVVQVIHVYILLNNEKHKNIENTTFKYDTTVFYLSIFKRQNHSDIMFYV
jgi:hypothetical protein